MGQESLTIKFSGNSTNDVLMLSCLLNARVVIMMFALETGVEDQLIDLSYLLCTYQGKCAHDIYMHTFPSDRPTQQDTSICKYTKEKCITIIQYDAWNSLDST